GGREDDDRSCCEGMQQAADRAPTVRQGAGWRADQLLLVAADDVTTRLRALAADAVLRGYRQKSERLRDEELSQAQRMLANGINAEAVLIQLARGLNNNLLHAPSVPLKKLTAERRVDALAMAQELFALGEGSAHNTPP
ncbi:hypothetical protein EWW49_28785, partial [Pseudomonas syringae]